MNKETIEKAIDARLDEPDNQWDGIFNSGYCRGFREAALWRINSVWHDASKKPESGENALIEIEYDNGIKDYILPLRGDHPNVITDEQGICFLLRDAKIIRWAYIKDLIPELETK